MGSPQLSHQSQGMDKVELATFTAAAQVAHCAGHLRTPHTVGKTCYMTNTRAATGISCFVPSSCRGGTPMCKPYCCAAGPQYSLPLGPGWRCPAAPPQQTRPHHHSEDIHLGSASNTVWLHGWGPYRGSRAYGAGQVSPPRRGQPTVSLLVCTQRLSQAVHGLHMATRGGQAAATHASLWGQSATPAGLSGGRPSWPPLGPLHAPRPSAGCLPAAPSACWLA
jgi:hypothetical protein